MQACLLYIAVAFTFCRVASRVVQGAAALTVAPVAICSFVPFLQWRMRRALHTCTSLIAKELQRRPPDIVVGSSWGSAVALRFLEAGYWAGPSLLLAPAVSAKGLSPGHLSIRKCLLLPRQRYSSCRFVPSADEMRTESHTRRPPSVVRSQPPNAKRCQVCMAFPPLTALFVIRRAMRTIRFLRRMS